LPTAHRTYLLIYFQLLCDTFVFKIVPMLNPDGVIVGNYRCALTGRDLNRNYKNPLKDSFPSIWHTKNMIKKLVLHTQLFVWLVILYEDHVKSFGMIY
jgi:hypothetical protein